MPAEPPTDCAYGFVVDTDYQNYAKRQGNPAAYRDQLARGQPPLIQFWYRQSPQSLTPINILGDVSQTDPPPINSGMVELNLDPRGRLIQFDAVPPQVEEKPASSRPLDWPTLFTAAGLDMARLTPAEPQWVPLVIADARGAWAGSYAQSPGLALRVEAASWRGKLVVVNGKETTGARVVAADFNAVLVSLTSNGFVVSVTDANAPVISLKKVKTSSYWIDSETELCINQLRISSVSDFTRLVGQPVTPIYDPSMKPRPSGEIYAVGLRGGDGTVNAPCRPSSH